MQTPITPEQRQAARREIVPQVEQGATASEARMRSPVSMHCTTEVFLSQVACADGAERFTDALAGWATHLWHPTEETGATEHPQCLYWLLGSSVQKHGLRD